MTVGHIVVRASVGILLVTVGLFAGETTRVASAKTSVTVLQTGDGLELTYGDSVPPSKAIIPLYRSGSSRYFSVGVGLEEREADYPRFPLKIVFVVGGKPYLTHVAVRISDETGAVNLVIPKDQIMGPWLFVDLPEGTYTVSGTWEGKTQTNKGIKIGKGSMTTIHLRWAEGEVR